MIDLATEFEHKGGEVLVIDEIHHVVDFEKHLKMMYDILNLRVVFSGSNAIKLEHAKADLSRRALVYRFGGFSFREFLEFKLGVTLQSYELEEILSGHTEIAIELTGLFRNLCQSGKITNTQGNTDEDRNRCRTICS